MLLIFIRSIIVYIMLFVTMRLMGKRQLGELQPFEFVVTLLIADLATIPMQDINVPILHGLVPIFAVFIIHLFISKLNFKSITFRKILDGKPTIVINDNGVDYKAMKSLNMHINDLMESLRGQGYFNINEVHIAIVETNGKLSVLPKFADSQVTNSDLKIEGKNVPLPYSLILEGKVMRTTIEKFGKFTIEQIKSVLKEENLSIKDVYLFAINDFGEIYLQPFDSKAINKQVEL